MQSLKISKQIQQCPLQKGHARVPDNDNLGCGINSRAKEWLNTGAPGGILTFPMQAHSQNLASQSACCHSLQNMVLDHKGALSPESSLA